MVGKVGEVSFWALAAWKVFILIKVGLENGKNIGLLRNTEFPPWMKSRRTKLVIEEVYESALLQRIGFYNFFWLKV